MRLIHGVLLACLLAIGAAPAAAQEPRTIVTSENGDYFGFDLRSEQNLSLDQCKATCLGDSACRAFTYNARAKWCFLKSDFNQLKPFPGAVAGKVVALSRDPDIGAPPGLAFVSESLVDEARAFGAGLSPDADGTAGLASLTQAAEAAMLSGDVRAAITSYTVAVALAPDDSALWAALSHAVLAVQPGEGEDAGKFQRDATSAAYRAYQTSRMAAARARALAVLAVALDRRDLSRPALQAYEASLALVNDATIRAEYDDLKARKGFRIVEHTVEADAASPRICAQFSEDLVKTGLDYTPFVTVDEAAPKAIEAKGRQICAEGLEHGRHYRVAFRSGLPAAIGEVLEAPVVLSVYVQDRAPSARFTGDSFVLPAGARRGIPMVTVNMAAADVKLFRIGDRSLAQLLSGYQFLRQLDGYEVSTIGDELGAPVWEGQIEIAGALNEEVTTSFPVDEALPERKPGVYVLTAQPVVDRSETYDSRATQWFVVSDIGLATYTGQDGLTVFARSLGSAMPLPDVDLTLLARNNEVLGQARTDAQGRATFTPGLARGTGGMAPAVLTATAEAEDFVFLDMTRAGFDLSDRGVTGRAAPGPLDVYAWTERGIYRVGEHVHVAALSRDDEADAVENLPLTFIFKRPDGVEDRRLVTAGGFAGGHAADLELTGNAMRGTWTVSVHTDPKQAAVAEVRFLVEDFVPDRIEFDLASDREEVAVGETATVQVDGRFLYGAPAAGLALEGEIALKTATEWERFPGYHFGLADEEEGEASRIPLDALPVVGQDGKATFPVRIDQVPSTTRLLLADVTVRMREGGGRAVERSVELGVEPQGSLLGIKPGFAGSEVPEASTARFEVISVDPAGMRQFAAGLRWSLVKVETNYQWYRSNNYWSYEPVTFTKAVADGVIETSAAQPGVISVAVDWGRYRLEVETADPAGPVTSFEFDAGYYVEAASTETPDGLEIALDKASYAPGEVAKLQVSPRFAGELLVTVGADRLLQTFVATVPEGGAAIDIPVAANWGAGAYVTATLFRPGDALETRMPARAIGVKWMAIEPGDKKLAVTLTPPAKTLPRQTLSVPVSVAGAQAGDNAYVTVAAVDVGILNLTNYAAPDPEAWFFGQRRLGLELRDLYGRLIDGSLGVTGRLRTGGDGGAMTAQGDPPTEKLVAFFEGPVKLDANGQTVVDFAIPQFNGTVRVMAVAWTREAVGHASADVIVRDPVVLTASLPRFLAPGDSAQMRIDVENTDAPAGDYAFSVETIGDLLAGGEAVPQTLALEQGKRQSLTVPLIAVASGQAGVTVRLTGPDGLTVEQSLPMLIRPATLPVTTRTVVSLAGDGGSLRVDRGLLADSLLEGATVSVGVSPAAAFDVASLVMTLDRYPYGCAEQTTSRALPLLYLSELSAGAGIPDDPAIRERIQAAIYNVLNFQSSSGSFGLWSPGYGDLWLDAYVTDFLTRARELDYDVPREAMLQAVNNLQNSIGYDIDLEERGNEIAYSLYVLARNKKASVGDLRYYADTQVEAFESPLALAQLAASLALYGDVQRSEATFRAALTLFESGVEYDQTRSDYGSRLRDGAATLSLAAESRPASAVTPQLIRLVAAERAARTSTSTQEDAWMLLAARALKEGGVAIRLDVDGTAHAGTYSATFSGQQVLDGPLTVTNRGRDSVEAVVTAVAAPVQPLPAGGLGFEIERTYYRLDGTEANVTEIDQNERFVVVLKTTELNDWPSRVLVTDLLPAGFEIDNPGLVSSAQLTNFPWLAQTETAHLEFRNDRFVAAFDRAAGADRSATLAYVVRAVTPGTYAHPAASIEDMYRPQYAARTATGVMEVRAR